MRRVMTVLALLVLGGCRRPTLQERTDAGSTTPPDARPSALSAGASNAARDEGRRVMATRLGTAPAAPPICGTNQVEEFLCGFVRSTTRAAPAPLSRCGIAGDDLEASDVFSFGDTIANRLADARAAWPARDPRNGDFSIDPRRTHAYRVDFAGNVARLLAERPETEASAWPDPDTACCYRRCAKLEAAEPAKERATKGWRTRRTCIPFERACPAGVRFGSGPAHDVAPFDGASTSSTGGKECCYLALVPLPTCFELGPSAANLPDDACTGPRVHHASGNPPR